MAESKNALACVGVSIKILYGGTFDPIHNGHLALALAAQATFQSDVFLLPSADPPHRPATSASAVQRAEMLDLAITGHAGLVADRRELQRLGKSYSVLTLREVRAEIGPDAPLAWLIGSDAFSQLDTWQDWPVLFTLAHFIVVERAGQAFENASPLLRRFCQARWQASPQALQNKSAGLLYRLPMAFRTESSTAIRRQKVRSDQMNGHLAPAVAAYIERHALYASGV